jgi:hypothetical protein
VVTKQEVSPAYNMGKTISNLLWLMIIVWMGRDMIDSFRIHRIEQMFISKSPPEGANVPISMVESHRSRVRLVGMHRNEGTLIKRKTYPGFRGIFETRGCRTETQRFMNPKTTPFSPNIL